MKRFVLGLMALVSANCYAENAEPDTTKVEQLQEASRTPLAGIDCCHLGDYLLAACDLH